MVPTLPYELHLTVAEGDADLFIATCMQIGVKPLLIVAQVQAKEDEVLKDLQTSSIIKGSWQDVCNELSRIRQGLEEAGFKVTREKVETSPYHPDAPSVEKKHLKMPSGCYFECHIPVIVEVINGIVPRYAELEDLVARHGAHLSRNAFKERNDGSGLVFMVTYRDYEMSIEAFTWAKCKLEDELSTEGFSVDLEGFALVEFACYDSNVSHDDNWLRKGPPLSFNTKPSQDGFNDHIGSGTSDLG